VSATNPSATATITDNDNLPANKIISLLTTTNAAEPGTNGSFIASLPTGYTVAEGVTVNYTIAGTATNGTDYTTLTGSIILPANQNSVAIPVTVTDDKIIEGNETVIVTIASGASATFGAFTAGTTKTGTSTITDDDNIPANKIISIVKNADGAEPSTNGSFIVSLPTGVTVKEDVTVNYTVSGTATSGTDFTAIGTSVKILAGNNSATINVPVLNDNIIESTETVIATVTGGTSTTFGAYTANATGNPATVNITDEDGVAGQVISITATTNVTEPTTNGVFRVSLPTGVTVTEDVTVNYTIAGTAVSGVDYTALTGTVKILAGQNGANITVPVLDDKIIEATETVIATVTGGTSATFGTYTASTTNGTATVNINDNDAASKVISIIKTDAAEPATNGLYTVSLPVGYTAFEDVTANYTITGTATSGIDYATLTTSVIIPAGQNFITIPLNVIDDNILENTETVILTITGGTSAVLGAYTAGAGATKTASANITDDDNIPANKIISIVKNTDASEPGTNGSFTVSLPAGITVKENVTVTFNTTGSTATSVTDYATIGTTVVIPAGSNSATINVNVVNDNLIENTEAVVVTITGATSATMNPYTINAGSNTATVTISDDDNTAANKVISITNNLHGAEPTVAGSFRISLPAGITASENITVTYTVAGTATPGAGKDYTALTGTTNIPVGANSILVNVAVLNDNVIENIETVIATVTGGTSASFSYTPSTTNDNATVNITDNDDLLANEIISFVTPTTSATEPAANGLFTVSLPTGVTVAEDVTVTYTVTGTASNGTDYAALSGTVVIPATLNKITIPLMVTDDIIIENAETVILTLNAATSASFANYTINAGAAKSASANITDNDNIPANKIISIVKTADASEPGTSGLFTVSLPAGVTVKEDVTVVFNVPLSSATANADYTALPGTSVKILAGNNSATLSVDVIDDNILEGNEAVIVNITSATSGPAGTGAYTVNGTSKQATVIIADDENTAANKVLSIAKNTDAAEPGTNGDFTVSLPPGVIAKEDITIVFGTPGGTAASGTDYLPFSGIYTIPLGQNSTLITLNIFDDKIIEGTETAIVTINGGTSPNIGAFTASTTNGQAGILIADDDNIAANKVISIIKTTDAAEPATSGLYTVSLPTGITVTENVTVNYTITGTAVAGIDYTALSGTVTIPAGTNNATITLDVLDDKIIEGSETVIVTLTGGSSVTYGTYTPNPGSNQATITINDDDNVSLNKIISIIKTTDAAEPSSNGLFTVSLPTGITVTEDVTVNYTPSGTATSGLDYATMTGSVVILAGANSATFAVTVIDDSFLEGTETVIASLNGGTSASFGTFPFTGSNSNATVNIADDDNIPANKVISIVKTTDASEPSSSGSFMVSLPPGVTVGEAVMVNYAITGTATSGVDFTALTGTVQISAGANSATIAVNIIDDKIIEPNETIIATVTGGTSPTVGAYTANPVKKAATVIITDDDDIAANKVISIVKTNDASEPATNGNFTISLPTGVSVAENVEVTYTVSGDAFPGVDYTTLTGTVIIPAGANSVLMPVKVADDNIIENLETVSVVIDGATSVKFTDYTIDPVNNNGTVNINDDDNTTANKVISIVKSGDATEPAANGSFTVRLPAGVSVIEGVTVNYTVTGTATAGTDYTTLTGTVVIAAGANSALIPVNVIDEKNLESLETVIATITNGSSATYGAYTASTIAGQATVTITDNDNIAANKVVSIAKTADAGEPATNGSFTVSLPAGVTVTTDVTMNYNMSGTATNGTDFTALTGSVIILAGQNSALIPVNITDDKMIEGTETFTVTLTAGTSGFGIFSASPTNKVATVTISDDDDIAVNKILSIIKTTDASEPATNGRFTVSLPAGVTVRESVTVNYTIAGTATSLDDYVPLSGSITIPAGVNNVLLNVNVTDDNIIEGDETVIATLTTATSTNFTFTAGGQATVTIADDENIAANKVVSIANTNDAAEPSTTGRFTVSLPAGITSVENVTVNYTVAGTAGATDYAPLSGSVIIPAGLNSALINVIVTDDGMIEGNETVIATLATATATTFTYTTTGQATVTIADDDDIAANKVISISTATNASEPGTNGVFRVSLPSGITTSENITVTYTVAGTAGTTDYAALTGTVIIPAGLNNAAVNVNVTDDNIIEGNETVIATITGATGTAFTYTAGGQATVTIADNDNTAAKKVISIINTTDASEPAANGLFTVSLPAGVTATEAITVTYTVAGTAGLTDYTALSGSVIITAGNNGALVNVNVTDDNIIEGNETVIATLTGAASTTFSFTANTAATVTIADDDNTTANKTITIVNTANAAEPGTNGRFTVSLPAGITATESVTVSYTVAGTAGVTDYAALSGSVIIPVGDNSATIDVNVTDDNIIEGAETVIATLTTAASTSFTFTANTAATVTITDDDDIVANKEISIVKTLDAAEPGTNGRFTVSLPAGVIIGENVTVNYTITGTAGSTDYTALTGSVIIPAGSSNAPINVIVINDNIIEGDETVIATVTGATSANFTYTVNATDNATVTITDDDNIAANEVISIVKTLDASEPATNGRFTVSLPAGITVAENITVTYSVAGTADNTDYTALTGTVTILTGSNNATIDVNVTDDVTIEGSETVITTLTGAASANFTFTAGTTATVTIADDDNTSVVSIVKTTDASEPGTSGRFTVSLPTGITIPENITVNYTITGTAGNADYTPLTGSVVIMAGSNDAVIDVNVTDDNIVEGAETVIATLTGATSANFTFTANTTATVTINDDDNIITNQVISIVKTTDAAEPATNGVFTVSLPAGITMTDNVTVNYTVGGTAGSTDYTALTGSVVISAGSNSAVINVNVTDDNIIEGNETVIATVTGATSANFTYTINTIDNATVTIADDDNTVANKVVSIVKTTDAAEPAANGVFTISLPAGITMTEDVTVNYTVTGTAGATDYTALSGTATISAGANNATISVMVTDDNLIEGSETVIATLTGATSANYTYTATAQATVTIADNDNTMQISIVKTTDASEPAGDGSFTVSLPMGLTTTEDVTVNYTIAGTATAGADYVALTGSVIIPLGMNSAPVLVDVIDDAAVEGAETVIVTVTGGSSASFTFTANPASNKATVTITDNDVAAVPRVISIIKTQDASEPATNGNFTVSLDAAVTENMTVNYTIAGTATAGTDYTALTGSVIILSGQTSAPIAVNVIDDIVVEGNETVVVTVTGGTSANFIYTVSAVSNATVNITDNDVAPVPKVISIAAIAGAAEPSADGGFRVSINNPVPENVTVNYTITGTATAGLDYTTLTGSVIIPAGQPDADIMVSVINDLLIETNETVVVTVTGATSANFTYTIGALNSATVTISDDDNTAINKSINVFKTTDAAEPFTHGEFVVVVQSIPANNLTVNYTVSGTAQSGIDYQMLSGSVQIPAGANTINIPVYVIDNLIVDGTRNVRITITGGSDGTVTYVPGANASDVMDITDNDILTTQFETWKMATLAATDTDGKVEQNESITYTVFVRNISNAPVSQLTVTDAIPANTEYVSGGTLAGSNVSFTVNNLQPGAVQQVSFVVKTLSDLAGVDEIRNTAYVTDGTVNMPTFACDPQDFSCNVGTVTIVPVLYMEPKGDLSISKSPVDLVGPYIIGKNITYKIVVKNEQNTTFTHLVITDELPAGLELPTSYSADKGITALSTTNRKVTCTVDQLLPGETVTMTITCKILSGEEIQNAAFVTAAEPEVSLTNNRAVSTVKTAGGDLYFVTAFRPGAAVNGKFTIVGLEKYPGSRLTVFDRWGSVAYQSENYQNNWTAANMAIGVYLYVVEVRKPEGIVVYKGTVTIIK
jgi:hypothetical protein